MSLHFSKTFAMKGGQDISVEIWSTGAEDLIKRKFKPILKDAYKLNSVKLSSSEVKSAALVIVYDGRTQEAIGGMFFKEMKNGLDTVKIRTWKEAVVSSMQRRGVGSKMYDALKQWAAENGKITEIESRVDAEDVNGMLFMDKQEGFIHRWTEGDEVIYQWWSLNIETESSDDEEEDGIDDAIDYLTL